MDNWFPSRAVKPDKRQIGGKILNGEKVLKKTEKGKTAYSSLAISLLAKKYLEGVMLSILVKISRTSFESL